MEPTSEILIIKVKGRKAADMVDQVATEIAFTLVINGHTLVSLLCSPLDLEAMAIGFLLSENILTENSTLRSIEVDEKLYRVMVELSNLPENWDKTFHKKTITSGCGQGVTFSDATSLGTSQGRKSALLRVDPQTILNLMVEFRSISELFLQTGGIHSAALAESRGIILSAEDIGRHNAVDKLIGKAYLRGISLKDKILLSSGRVSGEIMIKVIRAGIPILVSRAAPTCMAVSYAEDHGVTLIGFARTNRMNIYTHPLGLELDRLSLDGSISTGAGTED